MSKPFPVPLYDNECDEEHILHVTDAGDGQLVGHIRTTLDVGGARRPAIVSVALGPTGEAPEQTYGELSSWLHSLARAAEHELSGA